jgi:hypothetical protein
MTDEPAREAAQLREALAEWAQQFLDGLSFNEPKLRSEGWATRRAPVLVDSILADPKVLAALANLVALVRMGFLVMVGGERSEIGDVRGEPYKTGRIDQ